MSKQQQHPRVAQAEHLMQDYLDDLKALVNIDSGTYTKAGVDRVVGVFAGAFSVFRLHHAHRPAAAVRQSPRRDAHGRRIQWSPRAADWTHGYRLFRGRSREAALRPWAAQRYARRHRPRRARHEVRHPHRPLRAASAHRRAAGPVPERNLCLQQRRRDWFAQQQATDSGTGEGR